MKKFFMLVTVVCLVGCQPEADTPLRIPSPVGKKTKAESSARFEVERVGVFADELAYGDRRGIYIIKDGQTGKEYVGVSGIGISEVGSHPSGKTSVSDER